MIFFLKKTLQLNSQMTQQTILSEILVSLNRVNWCEVSFFSLPASFFLF